MEPTHFFEEEARVRTYRRIAGLDEAGRGPLAGPVAAAAVILPRSFFLPRLNDSKQLNESQRDQLYPQIIQRALGWGIGLATEKEIDVLNILEATRLALRRAIEALTHPQDFLLIDAVSLPTVRIPQRAIVKGDQLPVSIAAASILAKVKRDQLMRAYHARYPSYNFHIHKGYPTTAHLQLLARLGSCEAHRQSFRPVMASGRNPQEAE